MAITISERNRGRGIETGVNPGGGRTYVIQGTEIEAEAKAALIAAAPATNDDGVAVSRYRVTEIEQGIWDGVVEYNAKQSQKTTTESGRRIEVGGISQKVTYSKKCVLQTGSGVSATPNAPRPINVTHQGVEGIDVDFAVASWSEIHYFAASAITSTYHLLLADIFNCVNNASFRGWAAGCVLFKGAELEERPQTKDWKGTFKFMAAKHLTNVPIYYNNTAEITVSSKKAWEYLDIRYIEEDSNMGGSTVKIIDKKPVMAYVHQIFDDADFSRLAIGTDPY